MNTNEQHRTDCGEQVVNTDEQAAHMDAQPRTDGSGRCARCGKIGGSGQVGTLPAVTPDGGDAELCLSCFADRFASASALTEVEAKVIAAEHLGHNPGIIGEFVARPRITVRELRASASDKIEATDSPIVQETAAALNVPLPATSTE